MAEGRAVGLVLLGLGCREPEALPPEIVVGAATVTPSALVPTVVTVGFEASAAGVVRVTAGDVVVREVPAPLVDGRATATVVGLPADGAYGFVPVVGDVEGPSAAYDTPSAPAWLRGVVSEVDPSSDLAGGWLLTALTDVTHSGVVIWNGDGEPVWWVEADPAWTASAPRLTRDGRGVSWAVNDRARATDDQRVVRVELDGSAVTERPTPAAHHMVAELDRGELAWLAWEVREVPWVDGVPEAVLGDRVMVGVGEGATERLSFFDDRGPAYVPCAHGLLPDERLGVPVREWTHANSIVWLEDTDRLLIVARLLDAALLVDRETGAVVWQLGGRDATLRYEDPALAFSHGHLSEAWDGGFLMFDNGSHRDPPVSRVVEYAVEGDRARATWVHDHPEGRLVEFLGDARRLPSGNVLIAWSPEGRVEEVTRNGEVVWALDTAMGEIVGRVQYLSTLDPAP